MESPLWIDAHAPAIGDLPQGDVRAYLERVAPERMNLLLYGPRGSGKTAAVRALAREAHDDPDADLVEINVADFFGRTKSEIRDDPRFSRFLQGQTEFSKQYRDGTDKENKYKRDWSKRDMISHVLKEMAGYKPPSGAYKTVFLDNAEAMREDFQHALRRVMERHSEATQFVLATRQPTKLIPPIASRCVPIPVRAPTNEEVIGVLESIVAAEGVDANPDGLAYIAGHADGDLRAAILDAQTVAAESGEITRDAAYETLRDVGHDDRVREMLGYALAGEFADARSILDDLLFDEGFDGGEVLEAAVRVARARELVDDAALARLAGEIDFGLAEGTNDRLHLGHLLAALGGD